MKKTISVAALTVSASAAFAFIVPHPGQRDEKTYCVPVYSDASGSLTASTCDESANNAMLHRPVLENGCAENQVSLYTSKGAAEARFPIEIASCLPPNVAQL